MEVAELVAVVAIEAVGEVDLLFRVALRRPRAEFRGLVEDWESVELQGEKGRWCGSCTGIGGGEPGCCCAETPWCPYAAEAARRGLLDLADPSLNMGKKRGVTSDVGRE